MQRSNASDHECNSAITRSRYHHNIPRTAPERRRIAADRLDSTEYRQHREIPEAGDHPRGGRPPKYEDGTYNHGGSERPPRVSLHGKGPPTFRRQCDKLRWEARRSQSQSPAREPSPATRPATIERGRFWLAPLLSEGGDLGEEAHRPVRVRPHVSETRTGIARRRVEGLRSAALRAACLPSFVLGSPLAVSGTGNADDLRRGQAVR